MSELFRMPIPRKRFEEGDWVQCGFSGFVGVIIEVVLVKDSTNENPPRYYRIEGVDGTKRRSVTGNLKYLGRTQEEAFGNLL